VFDFCRQLLSHPGHLRVLGDGRQRKSYLYVQDCLDAVFHAIEHAKDPVNLFNLGAEQYCEVNDSIGWIAASLKVDPALEYTGGDRGWVGDNPFIFLDTTRIRSLGWRPKLTIREGVERTVRWLLENQWVLEARR
jgi:UDP-glucose 4-epimerase